MSKYIDLVYVHTDTGNELLTAPGFTNLNPGELVKTEIDEAEVISSITVDSDSETYAFIIGLIGGDAPRRITQKIRLEPLDYGEGKNNE